MSDENIFEIENGTLKQYNEPETCVVIPDGVTEIGDYAFYKKSSVTEIIIPASVTEISESAFFACPSQTIHAHAGTYAEEYAKQNSIPFEVL